MEDYCKKNPSFLADKQTKKRKIAVKENEDVEENDLKK